MHMAMCITGVITCACTWMTAVTAQIRLVNPSEIMWVIHRLKVIIADDLDNANSVCQRVYGRRD